MLGRKDYTREELDSATAAVTTQLAAFKKLAKAVEGGSDAKAKAALEAFEPLFCNTMLLMLDRLFVHRIRPVTGKDGNPLNEVELLTESVMNNGGVMQGNKVIKYVADESVLQLDVGDRVTLTAVDLERLAQAYLAELEARFVDAG